MFRRRPKPTEAQIAAKLAVQIDREAMMEACHLADRIVSDQTLVIQGYERERDDLITTGKLIARTHNFKMIHQHPDYPAFKFGVERLIEARDQLDREACDRVRDSLLIWTGQKPRPLSGFQGWRRAPDHLTEAAARADAGHVISTTDMSRDEFADILDERTIEVKEFMSAEEWRGKGSPMVWTPDLHETVRVTIPATIVAEYADHFTVEIGDGITGTTIDVMIDQIEPAEVRS